MMQHNVDLLTLAIGAMPGLLALAAAFVGYGRLVQRLVTVEQDVAEVKGLKDQLSRIDERTKNTATDVTEIRGTLGRLTDHLLTEPRGFSPTLRGRSRT